MPKNQLIAGFLFFLSLLGIGFGYMLLFHSTSLFFCVDSSFCESEQLLFGVAKPLFWSTYLLPFLFFGLIFVRKEVFWAWLKFITPFALVGLWIISKFSPLGGINFDPGRTSVTETIVQILVGLSVLPIAWKYWRLRGTKTRK